MESNQGQIEFQSIALSTELSRLSLNTAGEQEIHIQNDSIVKSVPPSSKSFYNISKCCIRLLSWLPAMTHHMLGSEILRRLGHSDHDSTCYLESDSTIYEPLLGVLGSREHGGKNDQEQGA